jgi:hypothetical protein
VECNTNHADRKSSLLSRGLCTQPPLLSETLLLRVRNFI